VDLRPIDDVCGPRLAEVRAWIGEGRYPPPLEGDLVPPDYLALVDDAGGIDQLRAHVEGRYVIAADMFGVLAGPDELDDAWDAFLAGDWLRDLVTATPEEVVRVARLVAAVERLLEHPQPDEWRWVNRLRARADHLRALTRPGSEAHEFALAALAQAPED
jgi:hypothetical protein